jgi:hypothetical protein
MCLLCARSRTTSQEKVKTANSTLTTENVSLAPDREFSHLATATTRFRESLWNDDRLLGVILEGQYDVA